MTSDKHYVWYMAGAENILGGVSLDKTYVYHAGDGDFDYEHDEGGGSGQGFGCYGEYEGDGTIHRDLSRPDDYYSDYYSTDDDDWAAMVKKALKGV